MWKVPFDEVLLRVLRKQRRQFARAELRLLPVGLDRLKQSKNLKRSFDRVQVQPQVIVIPVLTFKRQ